MGEVKILRDINLKINTGETIGVVGPSGSGKTSLLMVIAGLEKTSNGRIIVSDQLLNNLDEDELAQFRQANVGIVFQDFEMSNFRFW